MSCRAELCFAVVLAACLLPQEGSAEPCQEHPKDYPIVQLTKEDCTCCFDLDEFIQDNDYVYVLFYSTKGRLNIDINAKFEQLAEEWKWSRVHFGRIDTDKDREMSQKWVEPGMVPTNVMWKFGRPVEVKPKDFEQIRDRYAGSPEGQKWMLTKYMGEDADGTNLHYAAPLITAKKKNKFVKSNDIAIVGYFKRDNDMHHKMFCEAIWSLHRDIDRDDIGAGVAVVTMPSIVKKDNVQVPSVVVYLDGKAVEDDGAYAAQKWTIKGVTDFLRQFLPLNEDDALEGEDAEGQPRVEL